MCKFYEKPRKIIKFGDGFAIVHGINALAWKKTVRECIALCIEWKNRGHCTAGDIDRLFINHLIEWE